MLPITHQYLDQTRDEIRDAVFGNVGNLICFRVGESDAEQLAREFGHFFAPQQFTDLPNHHVLVRHLRQDDVGDPCHGVTTPTDFPRHNRREKLIRRSRERFTTPRRVVEGRIGRWLGRHDPADGID